MKPLQAAITAIAFALTLPLSTAAAGPAPAGATTSASAPAAAKTAPKPPPAWVARSNENAKLLLTAEGPFHPEMVTFFGVPGFDDQVADFGPKRDERFRAAVTQARDALQAKLGTERDPNVRQDLEILIKTADRHVEGSALEEKYLLPFFDAPELVFNGLKGLLSDQMPPERRAKALDRLRRYAGTVPGTTPLTTLARQRYEERAADSKLLRPSRAEVEKALSNVDTYAKAIPKLFEQYQLTGANDALAALDTQLRDYTAWLKTAVLPQARKDTILPEPIYAWQLKQMGIDIAPRELIARASVEFMETRSAMQQLAPQVAKARGLSVTDYRDVIRAIKKTQFERAEIEPYYRKTIDELERQIATNRIVDLPNRPMVMRLASDAENAAQPAPHFVPAPLVGNRGEQGQFVLPLSNPAAAGKAEAYDDWNFGAVAWTLAAHEGRPGHELQFSAMIERGVSLARTLFAFNSVNVEGWALYAESEMVPYEPADAQLFALQSRLLRAARAMLDPMLNLGLIDRPAAEKILLDEVVVSKANARQELDRYTFNSPGQAGSYFYGYSRILELRAETELSLGDAFDRMAFNNFLLDQGLLPPELLAKAVREEFIPARKKAALTRTSK